MSYLWDFGDGSSDTIKTPSHFYAASGQYNVTFTCNGILGDAYRDMITIQVEVLKFFDLV